MMLKHFAAYLFDLLREIYVVFCGVVGGWGGVGVCEGDPISGPVAMRLGVGGSWSIVGRIECG